MKSKKFKIGGINLWRNQNKKFIDQYAVVYWEAMELNGKDFIAGAVFGSDTWLDASMCMVDPDNEQEFCQALLRKAYSTPKPPQERKPAHEGTNIFGRKFRKCKSAKPWSWDKKQNIWVFELLPSELRQIVRR